jgi:hypothetical protein
LKKMNSGKGIMMFTSAYERASNKILAQCNPTKRIIILRFRNNKMMRINGSLHKTRAAVIYRKFWRMKMVK